MPVNAPYILDVLLKKNIFKNRSFAERTRNYNFHTHRKKLRDFYKTGRQDLMS